MTLESASQCNLCGSPNSSEFLAARDYQFGGTQTFEYRMCCNCGLISLNPRPDLATISEHYPAGEYYTHNLEDKRETLRSRVRFSAISRLPGYSEAHAKRKLPTPIDYIIGLLFRKKVISPTYVSEGRLLDVGCGNGFWLELLGEFGWKGMGIDVSRESVDACHRRGVTAIEGDIQTVNLPPRSFDCIMMLNVLEHVHDPSNAVRMARLLLRSGGQYVVTVPNVGGFESRVFREYWRGIEAPRHLFLFSENTLRRLLGQNGFEIVKVQHTSLFVSQWRESYSYLVRGEFGKVSSRRRLALLVHLLRVIWTTAQLMTKPIEMLLSILSGGSLRIGNFITVYSVKSESIDEPIPRP